MKNVVSSPKTDCYVIEMISIHWSDIVSWFFIAWYFYKFLYKPYLQMKLIKDQNWLNQNWFDLQVCNQGGRVFCVCEIAEKSYDEGTYISV